MNARTITLILIAMSPLTVMARTEELSLGDALDRALRTNPDVLAAEARVRQAEADLNAVRLRVTRDLAMMYAERDKSAALVDALKRNYETLSRMVDVGTASSAELNMAAVDLAEARGAITSTTAEIRYLTGGEASTNDVLGVGGTVGARERAVAIKKRPSFTGECLAALQTSLEGEIAQPSSLAEAVAALELQVGHQVEFVVGDQTLFDEMGQFTFRKRDARLQDALAALADTFQVAFIGRDYGFLVVRQAVADRHEGPIVPADIPHRVYR